MFFDDIDLKDKKTAKINSGILPPIPNTGWQRPTQFPDLTRAKVISFDVEAREPDFEYGPGWGRGKGHVVGVSVAALDERGNLFKGYYPIRHEVCPEQNFSPAQVLPWLKRCLETPNVPKVGANLIYDVGRLTSDNIYVEGDLHDVQFAEALLYESGLVNLEHLGQKYVGEGKDTGDMYNWIRTAYKTPEKKLRGEIYRTPPSLVGFYAESDADLPLQIIQKQFPLLDQQGLTPVYRMECDLIYLWVRMRLAGVSVDIDFAEQMHSKLTQEISALYGKLLHVSGRMVTSVNKVAELAPIFDAAGVSYPLTATGKPSITKGWLTACTHPVADLIKNIREMEKLKSTFLEGYILERNIDGKIYGSFNPLRSDGGGTRSGRVSSDNPNLQNIPARSELGKKIRQIFIPDVGHVCWEKDDYSQIEYRFLCHFAVGKGADEVRQQYTNDPNTDYHEFTQWLVKDKTGLEIPRKPIKNINFGLLYGMGKPKLIDQLNISKKEGDDIFEAYHSGAPYVKATMDTTAKEAQELGYITTMLGRRSRFDLWEPVEVDFDDRAEPLPYEKALAMYGSDIKRAHTHKAINRRLQGSAADQMKYAMWRAWKDGIFDYIGVPRLTVHDELDFSVINNNAAMDAAYKDLHNVMETALPLRVPVKVDSGRGAHWGAIE